MHGQERVAQVSDKPALGARRAEGAVQGRVSRRKQRQQRSRGGPRLIQKKGVGVGGAGAGTAGTFNRGDAIEATRKESKVACE